MSCSGDGVFRFRMMLQAAALLAFPALMVFAALSDLFTMTISNWVSLALIVIFIPFAYAVGLPPQEISLHMACGFGVLVLTFAMFAGALTLLLLNARLIPLPGWARRIGWLAHLHDRRTGIPYGIALAFAGLLVYPETSIWAAASLA